VIIIKEENQPPERDNKNIWDRIFGGSTKKQQLFQTTSEEVKKMIKEKAEELKRIEGMTEGQIKELTKKRIERSKQSGVLDLGSLRLREIPEEIREIKQNQTARGHPTLKGWGMLRAARTPG